MKLLTLLQNIEHQVISGNPNDVEITDLCFDSRKVGPGTLFVAVTGLGEDRHNFIGAALEGGAAAVVAEREVGCTGGCYVVVKNARQALAQMAANFYGNPAKDLRIIGVTGTNGKTTVTHLMKEILDLKGYKTGLIGTNHHLIGNQELSSGNTTPEAMDLHAILRKMCDEDVKFVVMEVSSHSLALDRVFGIEFETAVFTNLTQDHLDYHKTMEDYLTAKAKLFSMCRKAVLNADDGACAALKKACGSIKPVTYGIDKKADLVAKNIRYSERGVLFDMAEGGESQEIRINIPGRFSVYNALAAAAACETLGISSEDIKKGLVLAKGVKGRAEIVPVLAPFTVMIDYAHTPDGILNILNTVNGFKRGSVIIVFGCGGNRQKNKRPQMGEIAAKMADFCVVTSDNPRGEDPDEIIDDIVSGMTGYEDKFVRITNRREAISYALSRARENDIVLLAGKGHETYQVLGDETIHFDEREIVGELLAGDKEH